MSFVGTRPEVTKYVKKYTKEMRATLLLPAGITSEASIQYKDEAELVNEYFIRLESECFTELFQLWNGREVILLFQT